MSDFYIDGSYNKTKASYGVAVIQANNTIVHAAKYKIKTESKQHGAILSEIRAMFEAVKLAKNDDHIFSDCACIVSLINRDLTLKAQHTYLNSFMRQIISIKNKKNIKIFWRGRCSNTQLKTADYLAYYISTI